MIFSYFGLNIHAALRSQIRESHHRTVADSDSTPVQHKLPIAIHNNIQQWSDKLEMEIVWLDYILGKRP